MFGNKISLLIGKQSVLEKLKHYDHKIETDSENCFLVTIPVRQRNIEFKLGEYKKGQITVDVIDPFGFIRIPRKTFKKQEELSLFIKECFLKISDEKLK